MEVSHAKHKVYKIRYHMVICAKYRKMLLLEKDRIAFLKDLLHGITERYEIKFEAMGTDGNHFHVFVDAPPKYSPSEITHVVKGVTSRQMFMRFPEVKTILWGGELWSDGGYIGTAGDNTTADIIRDYILKQVSKEEKQDYKQFKIWNFP